MAKRIVREPTTLGGKPHVGGSSVTVEEVIRYMAGKIDAHEFLQAYPNLREEDLQACLEYVLELLEQNPPNERPSIGWSH